MSSSSDRSVNCVILGGGGHAGMLIDAIQASALEVSCAVLDSNQELWGSQVWDVPVVGGDDQLPELVRRGARWFAIGLGSTRDNGPRRRLFELGLARGLTPLTVRHPSATCSARATVGAGSLLMPGAIVNAGARLGVNVIVNTAAVVEHDCVIGDHAHIAPGAVLGGAVRVGVAAHVGVGAIILQCVSVGERAVIAAGSVVVRDVPAGALVMGVPARTTLSSDLKVEPS